MKKHNRKKLLIVLLDTEMGIKMTDKCMSVGLLCSVIGHSVDSERRNDLGISGKRPQRERSGIEMKSKGPK